MSQDNKRRYRLYRQISWYSKQAGMDRADVLMYAKEMFDDLGEIESTSDIATDALEDLLFGLKSWFAIQAVRNATGVLLTEAEVIVSRKHESASDCAKRQTEDDSWD